MAVLAGLAPVVSLARTLRLAALPGAVARLSASASIRASVALVLLLAALLSFAAPVLAVTPTLVCGVSLPPNVPGMVTVIGQLIAAPTAKVAVGRLGVQLPTTTLAPAGVPAVAVQVGLLAAVVLEMLLQVTLPVSTAPAAAVAGRPVIATLMSVVPAETATAIDPEHGVATVHAKSPPPLTLAVLLPVVAVAATLTGTVMTMGSAAPVAIEQSVKVPAPVVTAQPAMAAPLTKTGPLVVMPRGSVSVTLIGAVVGPLATAMLTV